MNSVLLVDDERLILYSLSTTFKADGYSVTAVESGTSAMKALAAQDFEICILDINLPDGNGLDIMRTVRQRSPRTGIIIISAADLTNQQMATIRDSGCQFLPKPFDLEQVRSLATTMISRLPDAADAPDPAVNSLPRPSVAM